MANSTENPVNNWIKTQRFASLLIRFLFELWIWISLASFSAWAIGGWYYYESIFFVFRVAIILIFVGGLVYCWLKYRKKRIIQSLLAAMIVFTYACWLPISPRNDRDWIPNHQTPAEIEIDRGVVSLKNVRRTEYTTPEEYSVNYEDRNFNISEICSVWFVVQRFTNLDSLAHTFLCFELKPNNDAPSQFFCVSVEVRCEKGEGYSPSRGLYRHYELMYTISDERDGIGFRTVTRAADRVYLFRCNATPKESQRVFLDISARVKKLKERPEFYHTLLNNCTNNLVAHANQAAKTRLNPMDIRIVLPGYSAQTAYRQGLIGKPGESLADLEARSRIDEIAKTIPLDENFSIAIRQKMNDQPE